MRVNLVLSSHHILAAMPALPVLSTGTRLVTILLLMPKLLGPKLVFAGQVKPFKAAPRYMATFQDHPSLPNGFPAIRECEPYHIDTPTGTVSIVVDRPKGVMDIFAEHDPHPLDWAVAVEMIKRLAYPEDLGEPDYLKGVDTWKITLRA